MPIPERTVHQIQNSPVDILITDDGSRTLVNKDIGEAYHSGCGAVAESAFVFLRNSNVMERLHENGTVRLLEIGFGTGLNFLCTVIAKEISGLANSSDLNRQLHYVGIDQYWPPVIILQQLNMAEGLMHGIQKGWLDSSLTDEVVTDQQSIVNQWCQWLLQRRNDFEKRSSCDPVELNGFSNDVRWRFIVNDAIAWLREQKIASASSGNQSDLFDVVYFDAFSPGYQPEFWTEAVMQDLFSLVAPKGVVVSYCVQRSVKDFLRSAGFVVEKLPGPPGGKRDVLAAVRP